MLGRAPPPKYKRYMDETLIELGVFLAGAGSGALLKYAQDRRLLHLYSEIIRQLSGALHQRGTEEQPEVDKARSALLREQVEKLRDKSASLTHSFALAKLVPVREVDKTTNVSNPLYC